MKDPVLPGAVLGVLGAGQIGRMFTLAARRMGYRVAVFAPETGSPAGQIAYREYCAPYDDIDAVERFAREVDVVTYEFENIPAATAAAAARHAAVRPRGEVLRAAQDRIVEKQALSDLGLPIAAYHVIENEAGAQAAAQARVDGVIKSAMLGYDGKGQRRVKHGDDVLPAWRELGEVRSVLEQWVPFEREVSVIGARGVTGEIVLYEPFENVHANHILDVTSFPARISRATRDSALEIARAVFEGLDVVGVLCVEMFVLGDGSVLVNELAPRPHNSGHVTIDSHVTSQFEQQIRAVCGLPLGIPTPVAPAAASVNLLGDLWAEGTPDWAAALAIPGVRLHLYGKSPALPGRKMGHLSVTGDDVGDATERALAARAALDSRTPRA